MSSREEEKENINTEYACSNDSNTKDINDLEHSNK